VRKYTITACILQTRSYEVEARNSDAAVALVRDEFDQLNFDVVDAEVEDVSFEEEL
jgi:hypothetical protein